MELNIRRAQISGITKMFADICGDEPLQLTETQVRVKLDSLEKKYEKFMSACDTLIGNSAKEEERKMHQ